MELLKEYALLAFSDYWDYFFVYEDGDRLTEREGEILTLFKLPICHYYSNAMRDIIAKNGKDIECVHSIHKFLTNESIYYALRTITDKEKLLKAKKYNADVDELLKSLLITHNKYLYFIFNDLFFENKITIDQTLNCLNFYRRNEKTGLMNLFKYTDIFEEKPKIEIEVFFNSREIKTPYLDEYILEFANHLIPDVYHLQDDFTEWCSITEPDFNQLILNNFQILYIRPLNYLQFYFLHIIFKDNKDILKKVILIAKYDAVKTVIGFSDNSFETSLVSDYLEDKKISFIDLKMLLINDGLNINGVSLSIIKGPNEKIFIVDKIEKL